MRLSDDLVMQLLHVLGLIHVEDLLVKCFPFLFVRFEFTHVELTRIRVGDVILRMFAHVIVHIK